MTGKNQIAFGEKEAKKFAECIAEKITADGLYASSKTDFYDFVLYNLNKYSDAHFLDTLSNFDNARLLKVTEQKVKSAKKNISVKFMDENEFAKVFNDFIENISTGKISLRDDADFYKFTIENNVLRSILEAKLKAATEETFTHSLNTEQVSIEKRFFLAMLANEQSTDVKSLFEKVSAHEKSADRKKALSDLAKGITNTVADNVPFANLTVQLLQTICKFVSHS